jgi:hypothetical protein
MAGGLPPPPTRAANGDFAWTAWYNQLYTLLSTSGSVSWALVNKAGSSIADLASKAHDLLTGLQGGTTGEHYHLTAAEHTALSGLGAHNSLTGIQGGTALQYYHLTSTNYTNVNALPTAATIVTTTNYATNNIVDKTTKTKAGAVVLADIPAGTWAIYKDTSGGSLALYANDGGVLKSVAIV